MKTFPWLKMRKKTDRELPYEPPIWLGNLSNGEFFREATPRDRKLRKAILETAADNARRIGMDRRQFLASAMGMTTSLWVINQVTACSSSDSKGSTTGGGKDAAAEGGYCVPKEAMFDEACANKIVGGNEFIFDVQSHWFNVDDLKNFQTFITATGPIIPACTEDAYINNMFCNSQTAVACLTAWPGITCTPTRRIGCGFPLSNAHMVESRDKINQLAGNSQRVLNHVQVLPQDPSGLDEQLRIMEEYYCQHGVAAWKMYPGWKPGFRFDEPNAEKIVQKGIELGVPLFCVHKGLPIGNFFDTVTNYPDDIGPVAKKYPDAKFVIYHSGICSGITSTSMLCNSVEGPFDPNETRPTGVNALIRNLLDNGIGPGGNVYAELGSAFNQVMGDVNQLGHFFGKLLKYVGEDNIVWGTDCIIYGSPQPFIEAMRTAQIPQTLRDQYQYPELTDAVKAKIFGLNAAKLYGIDPAVARCKVDTCPMTAAKDYLDGELGPRRWAFQEPSGPKTWGEWLQGAEDMVKAGRPG